jgi:NTE family protein
MKTALILPGGAAKGAMQLGACKVILETIKPDLIIGTSIGSLNGAVLADGKNLIENLKRLEDIWLTFKGREILQFNRELLYKFSNADSVYSNKGIRKFIDSSIRSRDFSELSVPLYVNCTNLNTGKSEFFSKGPLLEPLLASCSPAPILPPVIIDKVPYIDGALGSVLGIDKAIDLKCDRVIVVNIEHHEDFSMKKKGLSKEYADHVMAIDREQNIRNELRILRNEIPNVINIAPDCPIFELIPTSTKDVRSLMKLGEEEARRVLS